MASSFCEDLTCSICLTIFTDPVTLPCGHSFCRRCVTDALDAKRRCPHCQAAVPAAGSSLTTNFTLTSLVEKAKEAEKMKSEQGREAAELCPEHEEKLKLFCVTDQQLACIICRDGERHTGHKFKPVKEAAAALRKEMETFGEHVSGDIRDLEKKVNKQEEEMTKAKEKAQQLMSQISSQFEEMHEFLRKREDEIKTLLEDKEEDAIKMMAENLKSMENALFESRELEGNVTSVLKVTDSEQFLKGCSEGNSLVTAKNEFRPRWENLKVVNPPLSLKPYENLLQFSVWKQMLQVIQPRAEQLSLKTSDSNLTVSDNRRLISTFQNQQINQTHYKSYDYVYNTSYNYSVKSDGSALSVNEFTSGQHYWEIEVGQRDYWKLGIQTTVLQYNGQSYEVSGQIASEVQLQGRPCKIGIYINCSSKEVSFYDADTMTHIHTSSPGFTSLPVTAHVNLKHAQPDYHPVAVCWY